MHAEDLVIIAMKCYADQGNCKGPVYEANIIVWIARYGFINLQVKVNFLIRCEDL